MFPRADSAEFNNFEILENRTVDIGGEEGRSYRVFAERIEVRRLEKEYPGVVEVVRGGEEEI